MVTLVANPVCPLCRGTGYSVVRDGDCRCLRDPALDDIRPAAYLRPDAPIDGELLESDLRWTLVQARRVDAISLAASLRRAAARGNLPPDVPTLASWAEVNEDVAARLLDRMRAAVQTKKEGSVQ